MSWLKSLKPGDKVKLVCTMFLSTTSEIVTIKSIEQTCFVIQRENGTMPVQLNGRVSAWSGHIEPVES